MIKRVNFTGRRRIPRSRIDIEIYDGQPRTFDAAIDLDEIALPPQAAVFLEAMCAGSNAVERFEFGEVQDIRPPANRELTEIEGRNVFFTLKVVDRTERFGRILGIAENIRPERAGKDTVAGRQGILPIEAVDLGAELWKLDFRENHVCLLVNEKIPDMRDRVRSDPLFYAAVYPAVVRQVLAHAIREDAEPDEEDDRWPVMWLQFGRSLHPARQESPRSNEDPETIDEWVDEVVRVFCEKHALRDKYAAAVKNLGDDQ